MGEGLKRAVAAAKRSRTTGQEVEVRVWFPPGRTLYVERVLARDENGNLHELEMLGTRFVGK